LKTDSSASASEIALKRKITTSSSKLYRWFSGLTPSIPLAPEVNIKMWLNGGAAICLTKRQAEVKEPIHQYRLNQSLTRF